MKNNQLYNSFPIMPYFIGLILLVLLILIDQHNILDGPESSSNVLKIPFNRIVDIDTTITYECSPNDLDSLKEIKTIKIIYK